MNATKLASFGLFVYPFAYGRPLHSHSLVPTGLSNFLYIGVVPIAHNLTVRLLLHHGSSCHMQRGFRSDSFHSLASFRHPSTDDRHSSSSGFSSMYTQFFPPYLRVFALLWFVSVQFSSPCSSSFFHFLSATFYYTIVVAVVCCQFFRLLLLCGDIYPPLHCSCFFPFVLRSALRPFFAGPFTFSPPAVVRPLLTPCGWLIK